MISFLSRCPSPFPRNRQKEWQKLSALIHVISSVLSIHRSQHFPKMIPRTPLKISQDAAKFLEKFLCRKKLPLKRKFSRKCSLEWQFKCMTAESSHRWILWCIFKHNTKENKAMILATIPKGKKWEYQMLLPNNNTL